MVDPTLSPLSREPSVYEWRPALGMFYCNLCKKLSTPEHLNSVKHCSNIEYLRQTDTSCAMLCISASGERYDRPLNLVSNALPNPQETELGSYGARGSYVMEDDSVEPGQGLQRPMHPSVDSLATNTFDLVKGSQDVPLERNSPADFVPAPWEKHFSVEHDAHYFWNTETFESLWDPPLDGHGSDRQELVG